MDKYQKSIGRGVKAVREALKTINLANTTTLGDDQMRSQYDRYQRLALPERAAWVSRRIGSEDGLVIEREMTRFESEMGSRFNQDKMYRGTGDGK